MDAQKHRQNSSRWLWDAHHALEDDCLVRSSRNIAHRIAIFTLMLYCTLGVQPAFAYLDTVDAPTLYFSSRIDLLVQCRQLGGFSQDGGCVLPLEKWAIICATPNQYVYQTPGVMSGNNCIDPYWGYPRIYLGLIRTCASLNPPKTYPAIPYIYEYSKMRCERTIPDPETYTITLTPAAPTTEPSTLLSFNAVVKDQNGVVKPNKLVTIKADVQGGTGGHIHNENRPKGGFTCSSALGLSPASCTLTTDASGQAPFEFMATPISGKHTITATCDGCGNTETKSVDVMVSGLIPIPDAPLLYSLKDSKGVVGAIAGQHTANHYLTSTAIEQLVELANLYKTKINTKSVLYLNDASLEWGGLFDVSIDAPWSSPHILHDRGVSLDIRAENSGPNNEGAVPVTALLKFFTVADRNNFDAAMHCLDIKGASKIGSSCYGIPYNRHIHVDF